MTAITISRQIGSLGCKLAQVVSKRLGYRLVWRDLINQAAQRAHTPEVALATIDDLGLLGVSPSPKKRQAYHQAVKQLVDELADEGDVVIVGRAGEVLLGGRSGVLHVRVIAPLNVRIRRIARRYSVTHESARAQIESSDEARRTYMHQYYRVDWNDPELYDLFINTGSFSVPSAAALICEALEFRLHRTEST